MNGSNQSIVIVGGGVIGLCVGYYLSKSGHHVTILDRDPAWGQSSAYKNAGMVVPSHFIPLAAPGVITLGLKWMFSRKSPFHLRPRLSMELWRWCWTLLRHANPEHVARCSPLLRDLGMLSRRLFDELARDLGFLFVRRGLLMLCQSEAGLDEEIKVAELANQLGIEAEVCTPKRLRELEGNATIEAIGGVWFPQDGHLDSELFLRAMRTGIETRGGNVLTGEASHFRTSNNSITEVILSNGASIAGDQFVIAGGAWTSPIASAIKLRVPLQAGKGYSFTLAKLPERPVLCSLLKEARVAVTPLDGKLRVAGTMEICGQNLAINHHRTRGIIESFCRYYPAFSPHDFDGLAPWSGLRPCSPDGLPYIGRVPSVTNAFVATGHAMLGLSLGPVTGQLVTQLVNEEATSIDIRALAPHRFDKRYCISQ